MKAGDLIAYVVAQCLGAIAAAAVLWLIMSGKASGWNGGLGANGWGPGYLGEYNLLSAAVFEVVATFLFLVTILGVTQKGAPTQFAGLAIGLTLTAIHIVGINVTGVSVNPARSLGPALLVGGAALSQLWLFIVAPLIGAAVAGVLFRKKVLSAED
jgi:aquaporin Z